jgi:hypothetical protein
MPSQASNATLWFRFEAAREIYNACLLTCLNRLDRLTGDPLWYTIQSCPQDKRTEEHHKILSKYSLTLRRIHASLTKIWAGYEQVITRRDVQSMGQIIYNVIRLHLAGKRERPELLQPGQLTLIENDAQDKGIRWYGNAMRWNGLQIPIRIGQDVRLEGAVDHCAIRFELTPEGYARWFVQLIQYVPVQTRAAAG